MKKHKKIILLASAAFLVIVGATLGTFLGTGSAFPVGVETTVQNQLQAQGLPVSDVSQDAATGTLSVVIKSKTGGSPDDAWANTVIQREAGFLAQSGTLTADTVAVTIVDGQGKVLYEWSGPVDSQPRPAGKTADATALDRLKPALDAQASKQGVTLDSLSISADESQGVVVAAEETVTSSAVTTRDEAIKWATLGLISQLRDYVDGPGALDVDLYKISVRDAGGGALVEYVVDPAAKSVRAWMAPGVTPVWATGRPSPAPAAVSTKP